MTSNAINFVVEALRLSAQMQIPKCKLHRWGGRDALLTYVTVMFAVEGPDEAKAIIREFEKHGKFENWRRIDRVTFDEGVNPWLPPEMRVITVWIEGLPAVARRNEEWLGWKT